MKCSELYEDAKDDIVAELRSWDSSSLMSQEAKVVMYFAASEIERLRDELAECERVGGKFMEEIERLRAADVLMVAQFESQEREITMLRRLLREYLTADGQEFVGTYDDWLRRVREALGE